MSWQYFFLANKVYVTNQIFVWKISYQYFELENQLFLDHQILDVHEVFIVNQLFVMVDQLHKF